VVGKGGGGGGKKKRRRGGGGGGGKKKKNKNKKKINEANAQRGASYIYSSPKISRVFKCKRTIRVGL